MFYNLLSKIHRQRIKKQIFSKISNAKVYIFDRGTSICLLKNVLVFFLPQISRELWPKKWWVNLFCGSRKFKGKKQACPWECHSYGNPMGNVPWDGMGQHTFVFPMRLRNRMRVSECYWIVILRLYFWIFKSINFVVLHVSLYM